MRSLGRRPHPPSMRSPSTSRTYGPTGRNSCRRPARIVDVAQAFPYDQAPRYLILDRDAKYGHEVLTAIRHMGITPKQIMARSPWQNRVAERFVGTASRDLFDHVIARGQFRLSAISSAKGWGSCATSSPRPARRFPG